MVICMASTKITITIPNAQLAEVRRRVAAKESPSISGFIQSAVQRTLDGAPEFRELVARALAERALDTPIAEVMTRVPFTLESSATANDAALLIAKDEVDLLFELGSSTDMNKLETMAYKPAPITASWLGYPHSAGLESIDYILVDPFINPPIQRS